MKEHIMKRSIVRALVTIVVCGFASSGFANEAQPELQPTPVELGWFKRPSESTGMTSAPQSAPASKQVPNDYRFLTDYNP
jgi:hypothetical protein